MSELDADTFVRPDAGAWGTASNGKAWSKIGGPGSDAIVSDRGTLGNFNTYTIMGIGSGTTANIDAEVSMAQGPSGLNEGGISWRIQDINNNYRCLTFDNSIYIDKYVGGTHTNIANVFVGFTNTDEMHMRVQHIGDQLKVKFWKITSGEPGTWDIEITENSLSAAGQYGLFSDLAGGSGSGALEYWDFDVTDGTSGTTIVINASDTSNATDNASHGILTSPQGNALAQGSASYAASIAILDAGSAQDTFSIGSALARSDNVQATDVWSSLTALSQPDSGAAISALMLIQSLIRSGNAIATDRFSFEGRIIPQTNCTLIIRSGRATLKVSS